MRFSLDWLKQHLDTTAPPALISETLTALGLEVEELSVPRPDLKGFKVGEVLEVLPHPYADRLSICRVRVGGRVGGEVTDEVHGVVCGAPNVRRGLKSVFAPPGTRLPRSGVVIKKTEIRKVASEGMLCSAEELGLATGGGGIIELPTQTPIDGDPSAALPVVFDVAITPNRGDCAGVAGIARELAAAGIGRLKKLDETQMETAAATPLVPRLKTADCKTFAIALIKGVNNLKSPEWLVERLAIAGIGPINAAVDIGNYFAIDRCRPLHVFDADKVKSISVEAAEGGEEFSALDGEVYTLQKGMIAIKDGGEVISLGGIIGGRDSGVGENTRNILVECAAFSPARIALSSRALKIESAAGWRFERGVDDANAIRDLNAALGVMLKVCGGTLHKTSIVGETEHKRKRLSFDPGLVESLGGLRTTTAKINDGLKRLGFAVNGEWVTVPSWRADVENAADLVEEVLRLNGYEGITATPFGNGDGGDLPEGMRIEAVVRRAMAVRGMFEAVTWSFAANRLLGFYLNDGAAEALRLANPINDDMRYLRPSVIPNLLRCVAAAQARNEEEFALFELGPVWDENRRQRQILAGVRLGGDVFDAKLDLCHAFACLGLARLPLRQAGDVKGYHPGICGEYRNRGGTVATFGMLHPSLLKAAGVKSGKGGIAAFELFLEPLAGCPRAVREFSASRLQQTRRDFAFVVDEATPAAAVTDAIAAADHERLVSKAEVFDVYRGEGIPPGKKSLAVAVTLTPKRKTLSGGEIEAFAAAAIKAVERSCRAALRRQRSQ